MKRGTSMRFACCGVILWLGSMALTNPAVAADRWTCSFKDLTGSLPPGWQGEARIQVSGEWLEWTVPTVMPDSHGNMHVNQTTFRHRILNNNADGLVAVTSEVNKAADVGLIVLAEVIVLEKATGKLRMGSVTTNGVHDLLNGQCRAN